ncbi:hypothetical protein [Paragemmobacter straminiformis]|uniref:Uncharacterized protein n=1 Tax=Paragemmobacter straminiformis TaxID=2045119 RepID=A0A842I627_9RHOB|nr:hypothetical protein [Gemmobacter straminiformis]MBC2835109.1 hypothetical protein [Gemmobacter straminiformis]
MQFTKNHSFRSVLAALSTAAALASISGFPASAQVAIEVPAQALGVSLAACSSPSSCDAALQGLIDQLVAANPGADLALIIGSVIAAVAAGYNNGTIPAAVAEAALVSAGGIASSNGLTSLAAVATQAVATVVAGDPIDLEAVAEASGSPA